MGVEREVERAALPQGEAQQPPERLVVHLPLVVAEWRGGVGPHRLAPVVAREQPRARMHERLSRHGVQPLPQHRTTDALLVPEAHLELPAQVVGPEACAVDHLSPDGVQLVFR